MYKWQESSDYLRFIKIFADNKINNEIAQICLDFFLILQQLNKVYSYFEEIMECYKNESLKKFNSWELVDKIKKLNIDNFNSWISRLNEIEKIFKKQNISKGIEEIKFTKLKILSINSKIGIFINEMNTDKNSKIIFKFKNFFSNIRSKKKFSEKKSKDHFSKANYVIVFYKAKEIKINTEKIKGINLAQFFEKNVLQSDQLSKKEFGFYKMSMSNLTKNLNFSVKKMNQKKIPFI